MTEPTGYSRGDAHHLRALLRRAAYLATRLSAVTGAQPESHSYDRLELAGLRWAIDRIVRDNGALPADLDAQHAAIWPRLLVVTHP